MNRIIRLAVLLFGIALLLASCEKAPFITMTGPGSFNFNRDGGSQSISFTCNRPWSVSSTESWIQTSPSSGAASDGDITVTITCSPNTTYDPRNATITVRVDELMETIAVTQDTGLGLLVSPTSFDLTDAAQNIEIEVQKNVQYSISIDDAGKKWITHLGTKGLSSEKVSFSIAANEFYYNREAKITFKQTDGSLFETVVVRQSQNDETSIVIKTTGAGTLYKLLYEKITGEKAESDWGEEVWNFITEITVSGDIDARDFDTMKWNLQKIQNIDISDCVIKHYEGKYGTNEGYYEDNNEYSIYKANEVPIGSFFYWMFHFFRTFPQEFYDEGMKSILRVKLPEGITAIKRNAFARAYSLKEVNIPEGVTKIEMVAFRYCTSIEVLNLPSTLTDIGWLCFTDMYSLKEVHIKAVNVPKHDQSFGNYPDGDNRGYVVVGDNNYKEKTDATLYVPEGQLEKYTEAWGKYFDKIVEE